MIISLSYYMGDSSKYQYFNNFKEMKNFINNYLKISQQEFNHFEISVYTGKEEERVRDIIQDKKFPEDNKGVKDER